MQTKGSGPADRFNQAGSNAVGLIAGKRSAQQQMAIAQRLLTKLSSDQVMWCFLLRPLHFASHPLVSEEREQRHRGGEAGLVGFADSERHGQGDRQTSPLLPPWTVGYHWVSHMHDSTQACLMPTPFSQR